MIAGYGQGDYRISYGPCTQYLSPSPGLPAELVELRAIARQGDSGGPIFNARGELAGVLFGSGFGETMGAYCGRVRSFLYPLRETFLNLPPPDPLLVQANSLGPPGKGQSAAGPQALSAIPTGGYAPTDVARTGATGTNPPVTIPLIAGQDAMVAARTGPAGLSGGNSSAAAQIPPAAVGTLAGTPETFAPGRISGSFSSPANDDGRSWRPAAAQKPWQTGKTDSGNVPAPSGSSSSPSSLASSASNPTEAGSFSFADGQGRSNGAAVQDGSPGRGRSPGFERVARGGEPAQAYSQAAPDWTGSDDFTPNVSAPATAATGKNEYSRGKEPDSLTRPYESGWGSSGADDYAFSGGGTYGHSAHPRDFGNDFGGSTKGSAGPSQPDAAYRGATTASISTASEPKKAESQGSTGGRGTDLTDETSGFPNTVGGDFSRRIPGSSDGPAIGGAGTERGYSPIPIYDGDELNFSEKREEPSRFSLDKEPEFSSGSDVTGGTTEEKRPRDSRSSPNASPGRSYYTTSSEGENSRDTGDAVSTDDGGSSSHGEKDTYSPMARENSKTDTGRSKERPQYAASSSLREASGGNSTGVRNNAAHGETGESSRRGNAAGSSGGSRAVDSRKGSVGSRATADHESAAGGAGDPRARPGGSASSEAAQPADARGDDDRLRSGAEAAVDAAEPERKENPGEKITVGWETMIGVLGLLILFVQSMRWLSLLYDRSYYRRRTYRTARRRTAWTTPPPTAYRWYY